jgi:hypothetical protein
MAGGNSGEQDTLPPEMQQEQDLMFRDDLSEATGLIVRPPMHRVDDQGRIIWGQSDGGMSISPEVVREFRDTIEHIVADVAKSLAPEVPLDRKLPSHPYQQPPAAQGILEIAFMLWEHKEAIADNLGRLIVVGEVVKAVTKRTRAWMEENQREKSHSNPLEESARWVTPNGMRDPIITWTQGAAAAAVLSDAYSRYGLNEGCKVQVFPRGTPYTGGPAHPNAHISYLVRLEDGQRIFVYHVRADGQVDEHYQLAGDKITPLPIPDLVGNNDFPPVPYPGMIILTEER